jgi:predicted transcriptional regulator
MPKKLVEIPSKIIQTQVSLKPMSANDIAAFPRQVFRTLQALEKAETAGIYFECTQPVVEEVAAAKLTPQSSIQNDKVICPECGIEMRQLTLKHLVSYGMDQKQYKRKYRFSMRTPLATKPLIKARSKGAKKRGLSENLLKYIEARGR